MSDSPDAIRADIENTRREFGRDVDALADKVTPSKIVQRQTDKVRGAFHSMRERVMGTADDAGESMRDAASSVASGVSDAGHRVVAKAEGNPLAVGLIAFGVGLVAASLIPASAKEKRLAEDIKEQAQPLMDEAAGVARTVGEDLREPLQEAATAVRERATEAASTVQQDATDAAHTVTDSAADARDHLRDGS
jgi:gas vesicle protein